MKKDTLLFIILFFGFALAGYSQDVVLQRTSDLMPQRYVIEGEAFLEELDNGDLRLRLSDDFSTPRGPDVRILLGNSLSPNNTVEVVNLSRINHFSGSNTFAVPPGIEINEFSNILFFCVNFQQFWASGTFSDAVDPNGGSGFTCLSNIPTLSNGANEVNICPSDNISDQISFANNISAQNDNYAYLITNENDILEAVITGNNFDFEGSSMATQRVHGIHFDGDLNPVIGADRTQTTASGCFTHSAINGFVTISKSGTCTSNFVCEDNLTATTDWATLVEICPNDSEADWVVMRNNLFIAPGENYAYLITDSRQTVQEVSFDSLFNFEGSSLDEQRVYGVHYDGDLNPVIGAHRMQTSATGCFTHSGETIFLTIAKNACDSDYECVETLTATTNWVTEVDICSSDAQPDSIVLRNNLFEEAGDNYVYLITDESQILIDIVADSIYNFEGTGRETARVYGLSFDGDLTPKIGEHRRNTTSTDCFIHSGDNLFLTINKSAACNTTSTKTAFLQNQIQVYPNPSDGNVFINYGDISDVQRIELFDGTGKLVESINTETQVSIENRGVYLMRFVTPEHSITKKIFIK